MARRKRKIAPVIHLSVGPLSPRLMARFPGLLLVFSDASRRRQGGLAVVVFNDHAGEPLVATRTVPLDGSNELELSAALFALEVAAMCGAPGVVAALAAASFCWVRGHGSSRGNALADLHAAAAAA